MKFLKYTPELSSTFTFALNQATRMHLSINLHIKNINIYAFNAQKALMGNLIRLDAIHNSS